MSDKRPHEMIATVSSIVVLAAVVFLVRRKNAANGNATAAGPRGRSGADKK